MQILTYFGIFLLTKLISSFPIKFSADSKNIAFNSETFFYSQDQLSFCENQLQRIRTSGSELSVNIISSHALIPYLRKFYLRRVNKNWRNESLKSFDPQHVISFRPDSISQFFKVLQLVVGSSFGGRYRIWHPPSLFYWPFPLISAELVENMTKRENWKMCDFSAKPEPVSWKHFISQCIFSRNIIPAAKASFDVNQNIYFQFELASNDYTNNTVSSVWELYFVNGLTDSIPVLNEVVGDIRNWTINRIRRRSDFRNVHFTIVAPVSLYLLMPQCNGMITLIIIWINIFFNKLEHRRQLIPTFMGKHQRHVTAYGWEFPSNST